jgi:hypothetical protein
MEQRETGKRRRGPASPHDDMRVLADEIVSLILRLDVGGDSNIQELQLDPLVADEIIAVIGHPELPDACDIRDALTRVVQRQQKRETPDC